MFVYISNYVIRNKWKMHRAIILYNMRWTFDNFPYFFFFQTKSSDERRNKFFHTRKLGEQVKYSQMTDVCSLRPANSLVCQTLHAVKALAWMGVRHYTDIFSDRNSGNARKLRLKSERKMTELFIGNHKKSRII